MFEHDDEGTDQVPQVGTKNSYGCLIYPTSVSKEIKIASHICILIAKELVSFVELMSWLAKFVHDAEGTDQEPHVGIEN